MRNLVKKMLTLVVSLPLLMPNVVRTGAASGTPHTQTVYAVNDGVSAMTGHTILQNANAETEYYYIDGTPAYCLDHGAHAGGNNGSADLTVYEVFSASDAVAGGTYSQAISSSSNAGTFNYTHTYGTRDMAILSYIVEHGEHSGRGMAVTQMAMWLYSSAQSNIADRIESDVNRAGQIGVEGRALYNAAVAYANAGGMPTKNVKIYSSGNAWYQTFTTFTDEPMVGSVEILKKNSKPEMTEGNDNYAQSMEGAVYELRGANGLTVATLTTDANGYAKAEGIPAGNYTLVEVKAPKGFEVSVEQKPVTVTGALTHVDVFDKPLNDPVNIRLTKISEDLVENPASMEGAEFTVKFYAGQYTKETLPATPTRTWVIKTVKNASGKYVTGLRDEWKVSGDDFYLTQAGFPTLPLGTVTVEETKAPKGYTLKNKTLNTTDGTEISDGVALFNISENFEHIPGVVGGNEYTISEGVKRSGFEIKKIDEETNEPIGVAEFKILNANDFDVKYMHKDGTSEIIKAGEESAETIVTDSLGQYTSVVDALQSGKYKLIEVKAPEGYLINQYTDFEILDETAINTIGTTITVNEVKMHTKAVEKESQKNVLDGSKTEQTIVDTVKYKHLVVGKEYTVTGELAIKPIGKTNEELIATPSELFERVKNDNGDVITSSVTFTPTTPDGEVQVEFKINPSKYAGQKIVAFEKMEQGDLLVGHHAKILDTEQTVTVSMDLEVSIVKADKDNTSKVLKGAEITVFNADGTIAKDKNGKDAVGITDENGKVTFKLAYDQDNEMYVMETKAPEGYTLSTEKYPVKRTGNDKLGVDQISITVLDDKVPPTGIQSNMLVYAGVLIVAGIALSVVLLKKNKNK